MLALSSRQIAYFSLQLAVMLEGGVPLVEALNGLRGSEELGPSELATSILKKVESGFPLSQAFFQWPEHFGPMFVGTLAMAEKSGSLVSALRSLSDDLIRRERAKQQLFAALTYPAALVTVSFAMLLFLVNFMLPQFSPFLQSAHVETPWLTQVVLWVWGTKACLYGPVILAVLTFIIATTKGGRAWLKRGSRHLMRVKVIGPLIRLKLYSDACLQLSLQLECGVMLTEALWGVAKSSESPLFKQTFEAHVTALKNGESLSDSMALDPMAPPFLVQMIRTGEEVGKLPLFFQRIGSLLEADYQRSVESFFRILEPTIMVVMGLFVGIVVLACFLPLYELSSAF